MHDAKDIPRVWVEDQTTLGRLIAAMQASDPVYFDLEADSMHHHFAKICLMQVLADGTCYLVDPLAPIDLKPFLQVLAEKPLVLHGSDYDLRMLYQHYGFRPHRIFDTMIAAQLLGKKAFGLAALVNEFFGVIVGKDGQKADWSRRPLTTDLLDYASQDTHFLPGLHQALTRDLESRGRLTWHVESCQALVKATENIRVADPDRNWRVSGSSRMRPRQLAALKAMWDVRENEAKARDIPSFKIMPSDLLLRFAEDVPAEGLPEFVPRLPSRLDPKLRDEFLDAFADALHLPPEEWPRPLPPLPRPEKAPHPDLLAELRDIRDRIAKDLDLEPSLLAPRAVLHEVAVTGLPSPEIVRRAAEWMDWQEKLLLIPWMTAAERYRKPNRG